MRDRGWTFVEVSVVLVMMGLLLAVSFPRLQHSLVNYRLEAAVREIAASLREAQMLAINGDPQKITVRFDPGENAYEVEQGNPPRKEVRPMPPGVTLLDPIFNTKHYVAFEASGAPTPGGGSVTLAASTGRKYEIKVLVATGRVALEKIQ